MFYEEGNEYVCQISGKHNKFGEKLFMFTRQRAPLKQIVGHVMVCLFYV